MSTLLFHEPSGIKQKGQSAVEFMVFFAIIILLLVVVSYGTQNAVKDINRERYEMSVRDEINSIKNRIDMVYMAGDGFTANITIPDKMAGLDYEINITKGFLLVNISGTLKGAKLMTDNITGIIQKGENTISNVNNEMVIS